MRGSIDFPMSERLAENIRAHGVAWTAGWCRKQGFSLNEAMVLIRGAIRGWCFVVEGEEA